MNKDNIKTMTKADVDELKSGDIVYIRMRVSSFYGKEFDSDIGFLLDFPGCCGGTEHRMSKRWLHRSIMRENGIKNTETAPKYDPNRKFRKGDRARIVEYKGRNGTSAHPTGAVVTVDKDEEDCEWVFLKADNEHKLDVIDPAYLELVTPVEELEPYSVMGDKWYWHVLKAQNGGAITVCKFSKDFHPNAKAAAESERDRLNAEYRKEKK